MERTIRENKVLQKIKALSQWEALPGFLLLIATLLAITVANSPLVEEYNEVFHHINILPNMNLHAFINDFLMAIFFLVVGCEIKKEVISGHLSNVKNALFPIIAAFGGVTLPAIIYYIINFNSPYATGIGVPISTDIAFAIGAFMIFRKKLKGSMKIFLLTLAVVDDLISIIVIGVFYSSSIKLLPLLMAAIIFVVLLNLNKINKSEKLYPYFILGFILWTCVFMSGVHATISGVLLAIALPTTKCNCGCNRECALDRVEHHLNPYANFLILPLFAFSNTGITLSLSGIGGDGLTVALGIIIGLVLGKPLGILLFTTIAEKLNVAHRPAGVGIRDLLSVGTLAGIGFTMSIFVSQIAFDGNDNILNISKMSILMAACISCMVAFLLIIVFPKFKRAK